MVRLARDGGGVVQGGGYGGTRQEYTHTVWQLERLIEDGYERIVALVEGAGGG